MPKIIENVREQLLTEAKKQVSERGYANTTIRSVAGACGLATGTVYNYFESKEMLIATFVAEDWKAHLKTMSSFPADDTRELFKCIYDSLRGFADNNKRLFSDSDAAKVISIGFASRHQRLRGQLAEFVLPICKKNDLPNAEFTAQFIAESLISWAMENVEFDTVYGVLERII
jgi:AcrR family transcriptional regulator